MKTREGKVPRLRTKARVTLADVARAARVSPMTVSNVVNGHHGLMRPETRQRVEVVVRRLGYRPHSKARSLRQSRELVVGMLIIDQSPHYLADPFITQVVAGMSNRLSERGYGFLLQGTKAEALEDAIILRSARTDAFCVFLHGTTKQRRATLERLVRLGEPILAYQDTVDVPGADLCRLLQDDFGGGKRLAEHLLQRGARNFLMLAPSTLWPAVMRREEGLRAALDSTGRNCSFRLVRCGDARFARTQAALEAELEEHGPPDAIVAANDQMGIAAMRFLQARGLTVPGDVLVTGFNGFEFWQFTDPVITTVLSPAYEMGMRGASVLIDRIETGEFPARKITLPVSLQIGGST